MEKVLTLYFNLQDKNLDLSLMHGKKFILAVCPASIRNLSERDLELIKDFLKNGCILGQRGNHGICRYKHTDGTEPWHENFCLHNPSISFEEQFSFMKEGRDILKEKFGIEPVTYCPINHLYDMNTIKACQVLKYRYIMDLNLQGINPYENNSLIILPEVKLREKESESSSLVYAHYGSLKDKEIEDFINNNEFILPERLKVQNNKIEYLTVNEIKKKIRKLDKDLKIIKEKYGTE